MKTVIFAWTETASNLPSNGRSIHLGWGDILMGMVATYIVCKRYGYRFIIDIQKHPCSEYLKAVEHEFMNAVREYTDIPFIKGMHLEYYIRSNKNDIVMLMTNKRVDPKDVDDEIKEKIKSLLTKTELFEIYFNAQKSKLNLPTDYRVIHFRMGDNFLVRQPIRTRMLKRINSLYLKYKTGKDLLMSDSVVLKQYIKQQDHAVTMYDLERIAHLGHAQHQDDVRDTLVEFFLICECRFIRSFSVYAWPSGFALSPSVLYDIPFKNFSLRSRVAQLRPDHFSLRKWAVQLHAKWQRHRAE